MEKKITMVYVVSEHWEWESDDTDTNILGVYTNEETARKVMQKNYKLEKEDWSKNIVLDEEDLETNEFDNFCTLFNTENNIDYYRVEITETPLTTD